MKKKGKKELDVLHPNFHRELGSVSSKLSLGSWGTCVLDVAKKESESRVWAAFWSICGQNSALSAFFAPSDKSHRIV